MTDFLLTALVRKLEDSKFTVLRNVQLLPFLDSTVLKLYKLCTQDVATMASLVNKRIKDIVGGNSYRMKNKFFPPLYGHSSCKVGMSLTIWRMQYTK